MFGLTSNSCPTFAKEWALGCVDSLSATIESQEVGFPQPRVHSLSHPCKDTDDTALSCICILYWEHFQSFFPTLPSRSMLHLFHDHPLCYRQKFIPFNPDGLAMAAGGGGAVEQLMAAQMVQAAKVVEERLDEEMDRLENLNDEELDKVTICSVIQSRSLYKISRLAMFGFFHS